MGLWPPRRVTRTSGGVLLLHSPGEAFTPRAPLAALVTASASKDRSPEQLRHRHLESLGETLENRQGGVPFVTAFQLRYVRLRDSRSTGERYLGQPLCPPQRSQHLA